MIRQATYHDLPAIARVHRVCFPDSYSSQLARFDSLIGGGNLLEAFYSVYLKETPELFIVADDETHGVVGFCMGYFMDKDDQLQIFLHDNRIRVFWKTILLLIIGNKHTWKKIIARIKHKPSVNDWTIVDDKYEFIPTKERGDLLSVCVLPEFRKKGYAQGMMIKFLSAMRGSNMKLCLLSVKSDNEIARYYYEKNGFEVYRTRGEEGITYMKLL